MLDEVAKKHINTAVNKIVQLCTEHAYTHVHYSAKSESDESLGTAIFSPAPSEASTGSRGAVAGAPPLAGFAAADRLPLAPPPPSPPRSDEGEAEVVTVSLGLN